MSGRVEIDACEDCGVVHTWTEHDVSGGPCPACGDETCPVSDDGECCCTDCFNVWKGHLTTPPPPDVVEPDGGGERG